VIVRKFPEMKKIEVIIETHRLGEVCLALKAIGVSDVATSEVAGESRRKIGHEGSSTGDTQNGLSETRLEIVVSAERTADVIRAFAGTGWRDLLGDGKIVVYELSDPDRVRTPEPHENPR
jgi:nitrogen regulatory protein PII